MYKVNNYVLERIKTKVEKDLQTPGRLGATLRFKRKENKLTLSELSKKYHVSISYISKIENDLIKPNISYINPMLSGLSINEEMFRLSEMMDDWYKLAINHHIDKENNRTILKEYINQRNDFQGKLIEYSLLVKDNNITGANKLMSLLLHNIDQMTPIELSLFIFSMAEHHINEGDIITASLIFSQLNPTYIVYEGIKLWSYRIAFKISEYHSSLSQFEQIYDTYNKALIAHNMIDVLIYNREVFGNHQPFYNPSNLIQSLDEEMYENYRMSLVINEEYEIFKSLEPTDDLAQALYEDIVLKQKPKYRVNMFKNNLFEQALLEYFKVKYEKEDIIAYLRDMVFSNHEASQHYYILRFFANRLVEILSAQNKYKECYLVEERIKTLDVIKNKTMNFNHQTIYHI